MAASTPGKVGIDRGATFAVGAALEADWQEWRDWPFYCVSRGWTEIPRLSVGGII
jgi:hypothetical protein